MRQDGDIGCSCGGCVTEHYDVVVVGGGSAGVAAAVGAARLGARTLLVERYGFLGGAATHSIVLAYCGLYAASAATKPTLLVGGVASEVLRHVADIGVDFVPRQSAGSGNWVLPLNPEALKIGLDRVSAEAGVEMAAHTSLIGATVEGERITAITVADPAGLREVSGTAFVDASGDSALAFAAGLPPSPRYPASHQTAPASFPIRIGGISGELELDRAAIAAALDAVDDPPGRAVLRRLGSFITRLPGSDDLWWLVIDLITDGLSGTDMALAERDGRALAWRAVARLREAMPGFARANVVATGPKLGLRETRHVQSVDDVLESEAEAGLRRDDGIARAGWHMEVHHAPGKTEYRRIGGAGFFDVKLDALRALGLSNLYLAGRTIGADPMAFASVRVMGTAFATGHAAGVAAAMRSGGETSPQSVRTALLRQGAIL